MKDWQKGYDLDHLMVVEALYAEWNALCRGPFAQVKKHIIAAALAAGELDVSDHVTICTTTAKARTTIETVPGVVIGQKQIGDRVVHHFACLEGQEALCVARLNAIDGPAWLTVPAESARYQHLAVAANFAYVGGRVTSFAELFSVYFKEGGTQLFPREHPVVDAAEQLNIVRVMRKAFNAATIKRVLDTVAGIAFADHYSNYNKDHAWSAVSLRGYSTDPAFIEKPSEMNAKWHEAHQGQAWALTDTPLMDMFPDVQQLVANLGTAHRVRLMKLAPGGGELKRHTDLVDKDSGVADGKLVRFHVPVVTNKDVEFESWPLNAHGSAPVHAHMAAGELWYLDTRKPHRAVNGGTTDRIHVVIDVESTADVRARLTGAKP